MIAIQTAKTKQIMLSIPQLIYAGNTVVNATNSTYLITKGFSPDQSLLQMSKVCVGLEGAFEQFLTEKRILGDALDWLEQVE